MDVKAIFQGIADQMLLDFNAIQSQITHAGGRGGNWELILKKFLSKYLPKKYSVGSGQILDSKGNLSPQCDIVIYDAFNCPLILVSENHQIFPAEAVHAVIEVKSVLNASRISEAILNIQKVKQLDREEPIAGFLFAAASVYKGEVNYKGWQNGKVKYKIESVAQSFLEKSKDIPQKDVMDVVCVLPEGMITHVKYGPDWGSNYTDFTVLATVEPEPSILLLFFHNLLEQLDLRQIHKTYLVSYATGGALGIVRPMSLEPNPACVKVSNW